MKKKLTYMIGDTLMEISTRRKFFVKPSKDIKFKFEFYATQEIESYRFCSTRLLLIEKIK